MARKSKRNNPSGGNGKHSSPRLGEKTKQTKVAQAKETEMKEARQTKLDFTATFTPDKVKDATTPIIKATRSSATKTKLTFAAAVITGTPTNTEVLQTPNNEARSTAITPEVTRLLHPTPPPTPDNNNKTKETTNAETELTDEDDDKKPAAKTTKKKQKPKETFQTTTTKHREIRYNGWIETPPSTKPFEDFTTILNAYFQVIQDVLGKDIHLAAWDAEQDRAFPPIKKSSKLPESREALGIYLGSYINPKVDGSSIYLNLRLVTLKDNYVPLDRFGMEVADHMSRSKHRISMGKQPRPCQAARSECVGWLLYSCKSMNSTTFIPAIKKALHIPEEVAIGIQYRAIANEHGKKPAFNKEDPPASAIHLDINERYAMVYHAKASSLWRKNSKKRMPNEVQLRMVPCTTTAIGKCMPDAQKSDAVTLKERQYYFIKEHLKVLPNYFFISQLDTPLAPDNPMTLRRAIMSQAPKNQPTKRLIHNVDLAWRQTAKYIITTVVGRETEALRFLNNMIPEFLYRFGDEATKWFTSAGLIIYKDIKWNPVKGTTTSTKEHESEEMVNEDPWGLQTQWDQIKKTPTGDTPRPETTGLDATTGKASTSKESLPEQRTRLAGDKSIASFGNVYQRTKDDDDVNEEAKLAQEAAKQLEEITGTQFEFSTDQLERDKEKALNGPMSTGMSMSTAAKTTNSTRLKLKEAQEEIGALRIALAQQQGSPRPEALATTGTTVKGKEPIEPKACTMEEGNEILAAQKLGSHLIQHITETQAIGAVLEQKHRQELRQAEKTQWTRTNTRPYPLAVLPRQTRQR
jgi:hypothetical protein